MTITPATSATLYSAIKAAKPGDTIQVAPGAYPTLSLNGSATAFQFDPANPAHVVAADPANPPVLAGLMMSWVKGLAFSGLEVVDEPRGHINVNVGNSDSVSFDAMDIHTGGRAAIFRNSTNISLTNSHVHDIGMGLSLQDSKGLTVTGNYLHDLAADAIDGFRVDTVRIIGNTIARISAAPGVHADAIQFALNGSSAYRNDNIEVCNNVILADTGKPMQGIFGNVGAGFVARNNLLLNDMWNGIAIYGATDPLVELNWVQGRVGIMSADVIPKPMAPWIYLDKTCTLGRLLNNRGSIHGAPATATQSGNSPVPLAALGDYTDAVAWRGLRGISAGSLRAPPLPVVVVVDPRDAQIAGLRVQLAAATSDDVADEASIADLQAQLEKANADLATANAALAADEAKIAAAKAALT